MMRQCRWLALIIFLTAVAPCLGDEGNTGGGSPPSNTGNQSGNGGGADDNGKKDEAAKLLEAKRKAEEEQRGTKDKLFEAVGKGNALDNKTIDALKSRGITTEMLEAVAKGPDRTSLLGDPTYDALKGLLRDKLTDESGATGMSRTEADAFIRQLTQPNQTGKMYTVGGGVVDAGPVQQQTGGAPPTSLLPPSPTHASGVDPRDPAIVEQIKAGPPRVASPVQSTSQAPPPPTSPVGRPGGTFFEALSEMYKARGDYFGNLAKQSFDNARSVILSPGKTDTALEYLKGGFYKGTEYLDRFGQGLFGGLDKNPLRTVADMTPVSTALTAKDIVTDGMSKDKLALLALGVAPGGAGLFGRFFKSEARVAATEGKVLATAVKEEAAVAKVGATRSAGWFSQHPAVQQEQQSFFSALGSKGVTSTRLEESYRGVGRTELERIVSQEGMIPRSMQPGYQGTRFAQELKDQGADWMMTSHARGYTQHFVGVSKDLQIAESYGKQGAVLRVRNFEGAATEKYSSFGTKAQGGYGHRAEQEYLTRQPVSIENIDIRGPSGDWIPLNSPLGRSIADKILRR